MRRIAALITLVLCCLPGLAIARKLVHGTQKRVIVAAIRRSHDVGPSQTGSCMRVYVSTVNPSWATMQFIYVRRCEKQDANGIAIVHCTHGHWHFVTAGSAFSCPIPGHIPRHVQRDLKLGCVKQ
jgi:hypothetical protein